MKKALIIAIATISINANAQWSKSEKKEEGITDLYFYFLKNEIIAKKWTDLGDGYKYVSGINKGGYCQVWKKNELNCLSVFPNVESVFPINPKINITIGSYYNVIVVMEDDSKIEKTTVSTLNYNKKELILYLDEKDIIHLKTSKIKEIKIEGDTDDYLIDNGGNRMDVNYVQKCAKVVWPDVSKKARN